MTRLRIGVIGAGAVGQTVATCLMTAGWCSRLYIASRTEESATALVADLEDMQQVTGARTRAHVADPADMGVCDAIVVCPRATFTNTAQADVRMAGLTANAPVIADLGRTLNGYGGVLIVVTNPVDVMAQLLATTSGCQRVYGVGSNTDTARYRLLLADHLHVPVDYVQGHVIGEHGDAAVICASSTQVADLPATVPVPHIRAALTARPRRINVGTGRARSGPAGAVLAALRHTLGLDDGVIELSASHDGTWCGIPLRFTAGTPTVCLPALTPSETHLLAAARTKIRTAYATLPTHLTRRTRTMTSHATHVATDAHGVTVVSNTRYITDWTLRYFGPWWKATAAGTPVSGPMVVADIDKDQAGQYAQHVADREHQETVYANARLLYVQDDDGSVTAAQPDDQLAYCAEPSGRIHITGSDPVPVALAAARLAREVVRGQLLADGWSILHASAVTRDDQTVLTLGDKGAGKTTTALLLAHAGTGWRLLANDRVFVRAENGTVRVLPWPRPPPSASASSTPSASTTTSAPASSAATASTPPSTRRSPTPSSPAAAPPCGTRRARSSSRSSSPTSSPPGSVSTWPPKATRPASSSPASAPPPLPPSSTKTAPSPTPTSSPPAPKTATPTSSASPPPAPQPPLPTRSDSLANCPATPSPWATTSRPASRH
ncbi:NAD(P)-binding domain-containing protein [Streptomyces triculaminicus]|uniref:lactate/malate family dehydrogenase n=1 Tax=Streptomyces triculaminicus TaxID=2816232 RepID=UPI0033D7BFAA